MDEAIQYSIGNRGIADEFMPVFDRHFATDQGGVAGVAVFEQLAQVAVLERGQGSEAEVVDDDSVGRARRRA